MGTKSNRAEVMVLMYHFLGEILDYLGISVEIIHYVYLYFQLLMSIRNIKPVVHGH